MPATVGHGCCDRVFAIATSNLWIFEVTGMAGPVCHWICQPCPGTIQAGQTKLLLLRNVVLRASRHPDRIVLCTPALSLAPRAHGYVCRPGSRYVAGFVHAIGLYVRTTAHPCLPHSPGASNGRGRRSYRHAMATASSRYRQTSILKGSEEFFKIIFLRL